jgi:hypothetical protein
MITARAAPNKTHGAHGASVIKSMPVIPAVLAADVITFSAPEAGGHVVKLAW